YDPEEPIAMENGPAPVGDILPQVLIGTGQGIPAERGRFVWHAASQKVRPQWDPSYDLEPRQLTDAMIAHLNEVNGGQDASALFFGEKLSITFHPLGGCVMGQTTVLFGRVSGQAGLYVVDGSLIPGVTPLSNPCFTISAN